MHTTVTQRETIKNTELNCDQVYWKFTREYGKNELLN